MMVMMMMMAIHCTVSCAERMVQRSMTHAGMVQTLVQASQPARSQLEGDFVLIEFLLRSWPQFEEHFFYMHQVQEGWSREDRKASGP